MPANRLYARNYFLPHSNSHQAQLAEHCSVTRVQFLPQGSHRFNSCHRVQGSIPATGFPHREIDIRGIFHHVLERKFSHFISIPKKELSFSGRSEMIVLNNLHSCVTCHHKIAGPLSGHIGYGIIDGFISGFFPQCASPLPLNNSQTKSKNLEVYFVSYCAFKVLS